MGKSLTAVASALALASCGDASSPGDPHVWPESARLASASVEAYGWDHPVTPENAGTAAATPLGDAGDALAGHTLAEIVTDASVRVRGDGRACATCHDWATDIARAEFCARVPAFVAQPTATGTGDPESAKPEVLKVLLSRWRQRGCPE